MPRTPLTLLSPSFFMFFSSNSSISGDIHLVHSALRTDKLAMRRVM